MLFKTRLIHRLLTALFGTIIPVVVCPAVAATPDMPPRKPGLWQMTLTHEGGNRPPMISRMCTDKDTEARMLDMSANADSEMCTRSTGRRDGNTITSDSICRIGATTVTSHNITRMTGDTAYHTDINARYDPSMMGSSQSHTQMDAKWIGSCPADMVPGDLIMPNGMKMNMRETAGGAGKL